MTTNNQETALIESIQQAAQDEAQEILDNAQRTVQERKKSTDQRISELKKETQKRIEQQSAAIAHESERKIASIKRKQQLALKQQIIDVVTERVREKFEALVETPEFKEMILKWTVEAALGLEESNAVLKVTESCEPFADDSFCREAERRYKNLTGKATHLKRSPDVINKGHGIILQAENGRTVYNNLLQTRLYRHRDRIEARVLEDIFDE
ncbi:MAG: V-type ATP synthase subunit E [candidate division KSB1 bacterium]|nr:V-type ATP synthase subunit E [candidate division KSB1 bacterium]